MREKEKTSFLRLDPADVERVKQTISALKKKHYEISKILEKKQNESRIASQKNREYQLQQHHEYIKNKGLYNKLEGFEQEKKFMRYLVKQW